VSVLDQLDILQRVNRLKHEHGQLRLVVFAEGATRIAGYYLDGASATRA
jgi:hypothetical protein